MVKKRNKKSLFCYCHFGGELNVNEEKSVSYKGGSVDGVVVNEGTKYDAFVDMICEQLSITPTGKLFQYSVKFDRSCLLPLKDQNALDRLLQFNDDAGYVYVVEAKEAANPVVATTRSSGTKRQLVADVNADIDYADRDVVGFSNTDNDNDSSADQCANGDEPQLEGCSSTEKSPLMYDDCEKQLTGLGQIFHNAKDFRLAVYKYSVVKRFKYKYVKNSTKVIRVRCGADTCPWRVAATCIGNSGLLRVNKFIEKHDHEGLDGDFSQLYNAKMVSQLLKEKLKSSQGDLSSEILKVNRDDLSSQISNDIFRDISVQLTYSQSYQLKKRLKVAIHGKTEDTYKLIPWMCQYSMHLMPGTVAEWSSTEDNRFKQLFVAYHCSISGFQRGCRPLLFMDDYNFLEGCNGTLLTVNALDANDDVFPVAYGVAASASDVHWTWFAQKLKLVVGEREVVIVSNRNQSILNGLNEVLGPESHSHCYRHLKEDFSSFASQLHVGYNLKKAALDVLEGIAFARSSADYDKASLTLHQLNKDMYDWVLANGPEHWANSQFKRKRWDKLSSDETDAFNSWMSNEWQMPVLEFIKAHQCKLADLLSSRRRDNLNWKGPVGSAIEMRIRENMSKAQNLVIRQVSNFVFEIQLQSSLTVVDLTRMVCSCLEWQMTGIPCTHACKALQLVNLDVYQFVDKWYHRETQEIIYEELMLVVSLNDIPTTGDGSNTKDGVPFELQPPVMMPARGRPRGMPIRTRSSPTCSNCNEAGHNRKTCKMSQDNL